MECRCVKETKVFEILKRLKVKIVNYCCRDLQLKWCLYLFFYLVHLQYSSSCLRSMWAVFERNKNITAAENQLHISKFSSTLSHV